MSVSQESLGLSWHPGNTFELSAEGFYKQYDKIPFSIADGIPWLAKAMTTESSETKPCPLPPKDVHTA